MFSYYGMADNYEQRVVSHYEQGDVIVDTSYVTDGEKPYETGIAHKEYNQGSWVIVESYDKREDAQAGHNYDIFR